MPKKVLFISYYWPPSGGSGVQRALKTVKYLPQYGWEPIVYTPENSEAPILDESLFKDVSKDLVTVKTKIFEPYGIYKRLTGKKQEEKIDPNFFSKKKTGLKEKIARM